MEQTNEFEGWAVVELMGHRKLAGYVRAVTIAGGAFLRLDVPSQDADKPAVATQFYSPASVYCITPTTEDMARKVSRSHQPAPVARWELPAPTSPPHGRDDESEYEDDQ